MGATPDTELSLCTAWMATDLAKVQAWTRMQEFGMAMLQIQPLLPFPHLSRTASSTTYIRKISTVANLMILPFTDNRLCLLKSFLFAIVLHLVSSTSCFYTLLSIQPSKNSYSSSLKKMLLINFPLLPGNQIYETLWNRYELFYIKEFSPPSPLALNFLLALEGE